MTDIERAIEHFEYGITHDIFSEPVTTYAKLAVEAMRGKMDAEEFALRAQKEQERNPMTNADKIRSMTDEELAAFLDEGADFCHTGLCEDGETCRICCLRWLKQGVSE